MLRILVERSLMQVIMEERAKALYREGRAPVGGVVAGGQHGSASPSDGTAGNGVAGQRK
jgi:hypothetical protein